MRGFGRCIKQREREASGGGRPPRCPCCRREAYALFEGGTLAQQVVQQQAAAAQRAEGHWAEVRRKQAKAAELRALLKEQKQAEKEAQEAAWRVEDEFREVRTC